MAMKRRQRPQKKKKRSAIYGPLMFIIICAALIFGMSVFFRVSRIEVEGNTIYTEEELVAASGIEAGDNLFFINRFSAAGRIEERLPYVESVEITRYLPNRVMISVEESMALAYISVEASYVPSQDEAAATDAPQQSAATYTEYWIIDRSCKLLTAAEAAELSGLIEIRGLSAISPEVGSIIAPGQEESLKVPYLADILNQIQLRGMAADVSWIDISEAVSPQFDYLGRFTVRLGSNDSTEYKFGQLMSVVARLESGDTGTIELSADNPASFRPE